MTAACLDGPASWHSLSAVTPLSLALSILATAALLLASLLMIVGRRSRPVLSPRCLGPAGNQRVVDGRSVSDRAVGQTALDPPLSGARAVRGSMDRRGGGLYVPFNEGCLSWRQIAALHNEHRVVFTRLLALGLLSLNGQWDPQLQQVVNAGLHA